MEPSRRWTDDRVDDAIAQLWRAIDDLPNRMTKSEGREAIADEWMQRMEEAIDALRTDFNNSRKGMTLPERIALFSAGVSFIGLLIAATVLAIAVG